MPTAQKVVILHPDGAIVVAECPLTEEGPDRTTLIDVEGIAYHLYRYSALSLRGLETGYVAAPTVPTIEERTRISVTLFGPRATGIRSLERICGAPRTSPPNVRDMTPMGIVLQFSFQDGLAEDMFGERSNEGSVLAQFPNAICAYRFLRPSLNRFTPWIPVTMRDLGDVRASVIHRLEVLTGGHSIQMGVELANAATG